MANKIAFVPLLSKVQEYISTNYAASLSDSRKFGQLKPYIEKYLRDNGYAVEGTVLIVPVLLRTWMTFCRATLQELCLQTRSSLLCSTRHQLTACV